MNFLSVTNDHVYIHFSSWENGGNQVLKNIIKIKINYVFSHFNLTLDE